MRAEGERRRHWPANGVGAGPLPRAGVARRARHFLVRAFAVRVQQLKYRPDEVSHEPDRADGAVADRAGRPIGETSENIRASEWDRAEMWGGMWCMPRRCLGAPARPTFTLPPCLHVQQGAPPLGPSPEPAGTSTLGFTGTVSAATLIALSSASKGALAKREAG